MKKSKAHPYDFDLEQLTTILSLEFTAKKTVQVD